MGTDLHTYVERRIHGKWEHLPEFQNELFGDPTYSVFGFLAATTFAPFPRLLRRAAFPMM
jgi:hypothetical protein